MSGHSLDYDVLFTQGLTDSERNPSTPDLIFSSRRRAKLRLCP